MTFDPASVPEGCVYRPVPFSADRPLITPRSIFAHTMAASVRTTVQSAWNHATSNPNVNTLPHYALGLNATDGCAKFLSTDRRGIGNATITRKTMINGQLVWPTLLPDDRASIDAHGDIRNWSLVIETADTGTIADPTISAFTEYQIEMLTRILVHECRGWGIPAVPLSMWWGAGCATHTQPFTFPFTTFYRGKICPGSKKKAQFWAFVLPEVQRRLDPPPIIPEADVIPYASIKEVWVAPSVADVADGGDSDRWLNAIILKVGPIADVQERHALPVTGLYDQATAEAYALELAAMKATARV